MLKTRQGEPGQTHLQHCLLVAQDGTLVGTKGTAQFPVDEHDWKFFSKAVPKELQTFHEQGFKIVIFRYRPLYPHMHLVPDMMCCSIISVANLADS